MSDSNAHLKIADSLALPAVKPMCWTIAGHRWREFIKKWWTNNSLTFLAVFAYLYYFLNLQDLFKHVERDKENKINLF